MADIELVIKIDKEVYNALMHKEFKHLELDGNFIADEMAKSIVKGTPLPKGHGKIGDLDALREEVSSWGMNDYEPSDFTDVIDQADTIIEADKKYEAKVITRGNCMMCGKELTEGLFFCKECRDKASKRK